MNTPATISEAITYFESIVHKIQQEDSAYETDSLVRANDEILGEFVEYITASGDDDGIELTEYELLSTGGSTLRAIAAKTPDKIALLARHIAKFCGLRRCSVIVIIDGNEIRADAPDANDCERLLRVVDQLLIVKRASDDGLSEDTEAR